LQATTSSVRRSILPWRGAQRASHFVPFRLTLAKRIIEGDSEDGRMGFNLLRQRLVDGL